MDTQPIDVAAALQQMQTLADDAGKKFVTGNIDLVKALGEEEGATFLSALFHTTVIDKLQLLTPLAEDATAEQIAQQQALIAARDQQLMLVDAAEDKVASDMDALKSSAAKAAQGLLGSVLGTLGKALLAL